MSNTPEGADEDIRDDLGYPPKAEEWYFNLEGDSKSEYEFSMFEGGEQYF